jgi:hypothetical protein
MSDKERKTHIFVISDAFVGKKEEYFLLITVK